MTASNDSFWVDVSENSYIRFCMANDPAGLLAGSNELARGRGKQWAIDWLSEKRRYDHMYRMEVFRNQGRHYRPDNPDNLFIYNVFYIPIGDNPHVPNLKPGPGILTMKNYQIRNWKDAVQHVVFLGLDTVEPDSVVSFDDHTYLNKLVAGTQLSVAKFLSPETGPICLALGDYFGKWSWEPFRVGSDDDARDDESTP